MGRTVYAFLGLILGYVAVAAIGVLLASVADISQAEGAYMMGVFFFWGPLGAAAGAVLGAFLARPRP